MNKPKFTKEFKEAVARRVEEGTPLKAVARAYDIDPAVVRAWRDELRILGADAFSRNGKRKFTKVFKEAAVRCVEEGTPLKAVARAYRLHPSWLRRWRDALQDLGSKAFFDSEPKPKAVLFRVTKDEHNRLKAIAKSAGARSLSELARSRLLHETGQPLVGASRGKVRAVNVIFRVTEDEHNRLKAIAKAAGARSLSELLRSGLLHKTGPPSVGISRSKARAVAVLFRVTEDEHSRLKAITEAAGARSPSELLRSRLLLEAGQRSVGTSRNRTRAVHMSVTEDEHDRLKAIAKAAGARSLSEFARSRLLHETG
jgi:transposase-like protein